MPKTHFILPITFLLLGVLLIKIYPPASPTDTFYHLAVGREVYESKKIPTRDNFIYDLEIKEFVSVEWLSGLIFYSFVKFLGFQGLYIPRFVFGLLTFYFLYKSLKIFISNKFILAAALMAIGLNIAFRFNDRPEIFSLTFLSIINYICLNYHFRKKLSKLIYLLPPIFVIWPHIHPVTLIGLSVFSFNTLLIILSRKSARDKNYYLLLKIFLLCLLISLAQYQRLVFSFAVNQVSEIYGEFFSIKRYYQTHGFSSLFYFVHLFYFLFVFLYLGLLLATILKKIENTTTRKEKIARLSIYLFYLAILIAPFRHIRLIIMSLLLSSPILFLMLKKIFPISNNFSKRLPQSIYFLSLIVFIIMTATWPIGVLYKNLFNHVLRRDENLISFWGPEFPTKVPQIINNYLNSKRIFASNYWNNYFIWYNPQAQVFSDASLQTITNEKLIDEGKIGNGFGNWVELLGKYNIDTIVNRGPDSQFGASTPAYLLPDWQLVYLNGTAIVYARSNIIKSLPLDLSAIHPELTSDIKFKTDETQKAVKQLNDLIAFDNTNDFARIQLILYYRNKDIEQSKLLAKESLQLLPNNPWFSFLLASINARESNCNLARKYGKEAIKKSQNDDHIKNLVNKTTANCRNVSLEFNLDSKLYLN